MIFLGEKEVPTADFLSFLARCTDTNYYIDNSLVGISTWNPYGEFYFEYFFIVKIHKVTLISSSLQTTH